MRCERIGACGARTATRSRQAPYHQMESKDCTRGDHTAALPSRGPVAVASLGSTARSSSVEIGALLHDIGKSSSPTDPPQGIRTARRERLGESCASTRLISASSSPISTSTRSVASAPGRAIAHRTVPDYPAACAARMWPVPPGSSFVADAFECDHERPSVPAGTVNDQALAYIEANAGTQFSRAVVRRSAKSG